jgi:ABC-type multidrug transport system fused ATPase/permease subunit
VQQDVFLFDGSVCDNITYGRHDATDGEVEHAALAITSG